MLMDPTAGSTIQEDLRWKFNNGSLSRQIPLFNSSMGFGSHCNLWYFWGRTLDPKLSVMKIMIVILWSQELFDQTGSHSYILLLYHLLTKYNQKQLINLCMFQTCNWKMLTNYENMVYKMIVFILLQLDPVWISTQNIIFDLGSGISPPTWPWKWIYDLSGSAGNCEGWICDPNRSGIQIHGQGRNHVKKVVRNVGQGRFAWGGAALFKGAPMPKCTILKMQNSTGATWWRRPLANRPTR